MTPLQIEIVMNAYVGKNYGEVHNWGNLTVRNQAGQLEELGLIKIRFSEELVTAFADITEKGSAYARLICNTPIPEQAFVDAQGRIIE